MSCNCSCTWEIRLKTDEEIIAAFREEMKEELEAIEGTPEQQALLDQIDEANKPMAWVMWTCKTCGYTKTSSSPYRNANEKCDVCGGEMKLGGSGDIFDREKIEPLLTKGQKKQADKINNTVKDHLTKDDWSGTLNDLQGKPITRANGEPYQHKYEMQCSYDGLCRARESIENSLRNPNLKPEVREFLISERNQANIYIERIEKLFKPYGGIKWVKGKR